MAKRRSKKKPRLECVTTRPAACPRCHCTDRTEKESVITRDIIGATHPGKVPYTQVQWSYCTCKECGMRYRFMEYLKPASRTSEKTPLQGE